MGHNYLQLFYHFIWSTRGREPSITPEREPVVYGYIRQRCGESRVLVHALDGMPDHVHLVCTLPTSLCIGDFLEMVKGASSHFANHLPGGERWLHWQPGYGGLTVSKRDLPRVVAYVQGQKEHHRSGRLILGLERIEE